MNRIGLTLILIGAGTLAMAQDFDVIIAGGTVYDGSGTAPYGADVGIRDDRIGAIGDLSEAGGMRVDATGLAVAPGFVNMLSHAQVALLVDPRGMSDTLQGVTLEVFGESSMGPWNERMKRDNLRFQGDLKYDIAWTTLGEYLEHLVGRGVTPNVASFVSATTIRIHEIGYEDRAPTDDELTRMKELTAQAMEEGAMGLTTALIYAPANYAQTDELIALAEVAGEYGGMYIVHMRSEGNQWMDAIDETIQIAREADLPAEIYHFKAAGQQNWDKVDAAVERIEAARADGLRITANMYTYVAGSTGLDASMPPWVQEGGYDGWSRRLRDPAIRARVAAEMKTDSDEWENLYFGAGSPDNIVLVGFRNEELKKYTGMTLAEVAEARGTSPEETAMDLVVEDGSRVLSVYFLMSEENVKRQIQLPWMSFCSDSPSLAAEGVFLRSSLHPRAYGSFARLLGKYVREEKVIPLEEAVRRLTSLPAGNLGIEDRGRLDVGMYADVVVFDPDRVADTATFDKPHSYATGMVHVFINGEQVVRDGEHTGATPGRIVRGPGWRGD